MERELEVDDYFELSDGSYITIDKINYLNNNYIFANKLRGETPTGEFVVFKCQENGIVLEKNKEVLDKLLKIFSDNMNEKLAFINQEINSKGE